VRFGTGITAASVAPSRNVMDLVLARGTDNVTVQNWFAANANKIERVEFADSAVWDVATLRALTNLSPVTANAVGDQAATEDVALALRCLPTRSRMRMRLSVIRSPTA